jgi:Lysyl oxidase/WD40-like Beta Propeller Repeat
VIAPLLLSAVALAPPGEIAVHMPVGLWTYERGELRRLVEHGSQPDWSPDGDRLVYGRRRADNADLWLADGDGSSQLQLTRTPGDEEDPAWAPDGRRIAFSRDGWVYVLRADGLGERRVARGREPDWSPDGEELVFASDRDGDSDLYVVRAAGGGLRRLTAEPSQERSPAWSPLGGRIAYVSDVAGNDEIHALRPDGRGKLRLTNQPGRDLEPAWAPNGSRIVFVGDRSAFRFLLSMRPDGSDPRAIAQTSGHHDPAWRPRPHVRELLPDLHQHPPHQLTVAHLRGRWVLGFSSAVDNVGEGAMWLLGARASRSRRIMEASQRILLSSGGWRREASVGYWRYVFADSHAHWHFLPFERYELRDAEGAILVRDRKSGFCLGDRFPLGARAAPPRFPPSACQSGNPAALSVFGGTSVGYTDRYFPHFHGQNVTLTGVPAGRYVLVHRVNPGLLFRESRYDNNVASVAIRLTWARGVPRVRLLRTCGGSAAC